MINFITRISLVLAIAVFSLAGQSAFAPILAKHNTLRYRIQLGSQISPHRVAEVSRYLDSQDFDVAGLNHETNSLDVITNQEGIQKLKAQGLNGFVVNLTETFKPDARYLNPSSLAQRLQQINQINPQISRIVEIGKSNQGRPILAMLISTTLDFNSPEYYKKPSIIFDGLHHAREIMTPEIVADVGETLLRNTSVKQVNDILNRWNVWIVPMLNPDGSNIVWTSDTMWRKNARADGNSIFGVDINRNYGYRWGECRGSSNSKNSDTYRGASPASEPEIQAITSLADTIHPTASISYHSYSELILYPYGCEGDVTSENALIQKVAGELSNLLPTDSGKGKYKPGTPWQLLYSVDGSSMDYMYAAHGALAYTFEVNQDFQPAYELRDPTVKKHRAAWLYFINRATQNMLVVDVIDKKTNQQVPAMIAVDKVQQTKKEASLKTNRFGRFFKVLDPGTYFVAAKLQDGRTAQIQVTMNGQANLQRIEIP